MATPIPNIFTSYSLSPEEELAGQILSPQQECVIRNKLVATAREKLLLQYDPSNPMKFLQQEAELQGQLGILQWQLDCSEEATHVLHNMSHPQPE